MPQIITANNLNTAIPEIKKKGALVLVGGCFDILHPGHTQFLQNAKNTGEILLVMLESDESITKTKGAGRPIHSQKDRAQKLLEIPFVDYVLLLPTLKTNEDYYEMTKRLQPDIIAVTKGDPILLHKQKQAEEVGAKVVEVIERLPNHSTTNLIDNKTQI